MTASTPTTEAFADRLLGVLNDGALALMISIGHRTGLFDTLLARDLGGRRERLQ